MVNAGTTASPVNYPTKTIYRNRTKDEDGNEVIEYVNTDGRVLLKRVQAVASPSAIDDTKYASTYYIYDDFGNLVCVLPPEASKRLVAEYLNATAVNKEAFLKRWAFRYKYDERGRMIRKQVPGAGQVIMIYDDLDRLTLVQDSVQRTKSPREWTFTKYDVHGRPVLTGKYTNNNLYTAMKAAVATHYNGIPVWYETYKGATGAVLGYDNVSFPLTTNEADYYAVTFYDQYDTYIAPSGYAYTTQSLTDPETSLVQATVANINAVRPFGQITGILVKNLSTGTWLRTVTYYDQKYRPVQKHQRPSKRESDIIQHCRFHGQGCLFKAHLCGERCFQVCE